MKDHEDEAIARRQAVMKMLGAAVGGVALAACADETMAGQEAPEIEERAQGLSATNYLTYDTILGSTGLLSNNPGPSNTALITAVVLGYEYAGDSGGGIFVWERTATYPPNNGTIFQPTGSTTSGRWMRNVSGSTAVDPRWFGARPKTPTGAAAPYAYPVKDNTQAFNDAFSALTNDPRFLMPSAIDATVSPVRTVLVPPGVYQTTGTIRMQGDGVWLVGSGPSSEIQYTAATGYAGGAERYAIWVGGTATQRFRECGLQNFAVTLTQTAANPSLQGCIKVAEATRTRLNLLYLEALKPASGPYTGTGVLLGNGAWAVDISGGLYMHLAYGVRVQKLNPTTGASNPAAELQVFNGNAIHGGLEIVGCEYGIMIGDGIINNGNTAETGNYFLGAAIDIRDIIVELCVLGGIWVVSGMNVYIGKGVWMEANKNFHVRIGKDNHIGAGDHRPFRCVVDEAYFQTGSSAVPGVPFAHVDVQSGSMCRVSNNDFHSYDTTDIAVRLGPGADQTVIYDNFSHANIKDVVSVNAVNTYFRKEGVTRRIDSEVPCRFEGAVVPANVQTARGARNSPSKFVFRGHYDPNNANPYPAGTNPSADATMDAEVALNVSGSGANPTAELGFYLNGGPALQLYRTGDGYGYARASSYRLVKSVSPDQWVSTVNYAITSRYQVAKLTGINNNITLASTPSIVAGVADGQELEIVNATFPNYPPNFSGINPDPTFWLGVTIRDESVWTGSKIRLKSGTTLTLGPRQSARFLWMATYGEWWQV